MTLKKNVVCHIGYQCRDNGYVVENGGIFGYWTGEVDRYGKHTIHSVEDDLTVYLFKDEIVHVEAAS